MRKYIIVPRTNKYVWALLNLRKSTQTIDIVVGPKRGSTAKFGRGHTRAKEASGYMKANSFHVTA